MDTEELLDRGFTCQLKGQLEKAEDCFKKALVQNPKLKGAHLGLGDVYLKKDEIDMAEEMYTKEIEINPGSVKAHVELANMYLLKSETDKALANFEKVLLLSPNDWRASKGMGYIYLIRGELEKASGWLNMAVEESEEDLSIHFWLTLVYQKKGLIAEMDKEIEKVRAICKNIEKFTAKKAVVASYVLGKIAFLQEKHKEAIKNLEDLRKRIKIRDRKRIEFGLVYDEVDILQTLAEVYDKTGEKTLCDTIQKEIESLTQAKSS